LQAGPTDAELSSRQLALRQAEDNLTQVRATTSAAKLEAEAALNQKDFALHNAQEAYQSMAAQVLDGAGNLQGDLPQAVVDEFHKVERAYHAAEIEYHNAERTLADARQAEFRDVAAAQAKRDDAQRQYDDWLKGPSATELTTAQAAVYSAQQTLDTLKAKPAAADVNTAQTTLLKAQRSVADLLAPPAVADAQTAQATLLKAQKALADLQAKPLPADVADAQATLLKAQKALADLQAKPAPADVADAQATLLKAQNALADLQARPTPADLAGAESQVAAAEAALQKLQAPATPADQAGADADVMQAQVALDKARKAQAEATLTAPFAGLVAKVSTDADSLVTAGAAAFTLDDDTALHLDLDVSESDVARLQIGQATSVTLDALPEQPITGTVSSIAGVGSVSQSVVTYRVQVRLAPGHAAVKVGMSGTATITVERHAGVLQVPNAAIQTAGPFPTVQVLYGNAQTPVTVRVRTGATDGRMTEIVGCLDTGNQCLRAGDQVGLDRPASGDKTAAGPGQGDVMFVGPGLSTGGAPPSKGGSGPQQIFISP
jgi:multidrug efflux pump subunit AcrA (membrane-fusion protein)